MMLLSLLFWALFASYIIHILDESLLNGGFVQWIVDNFWPTYTWRMFFWFNAGALAAIAASNLLFDSFGGHWVILPLIWVAGFVTHAATVHVYWTIRRNTYSPGLLTSLLYVLVYYLLIRYGLGPQLMSGADFAIGTVVGVATVGAFLTVGPTVLFPRLTRSRHRLA
ncbi:MAG TPA: HXXEE domain-containing protein [Ktedonobacterales bacterium]|nr:HXXEE domain-containing protein [Ktedonobacterales bacterium]